MVTLHTALNHLTVRLLIMFKTVFLLVFLSRFFLSVTSLEAPSPPYMRPEDQCDLEPSCCEHCVPFSLAPRALHSLRPTKATPSSLKISFLLCLLICGDIESNPCPGLDVCLVCDSEVANNDHGLFCEVCSNWSHRSCVNMSVDEYFHWAAIEDGWICPQCEKEAFPFYDASLLSSCSSHSALSKSDSTQFPSIPSFSVLSFNVSEPHTRNANVSEPHKGGGMGAAMAAPLFSSNVGHAL